MGWWEEGEIVGGRDEVAGGTWLACSRGGRVALLTNVLELHTLPEAKSRGDLPVLFLQVTLNVNLLSKKQQKIKGLKYTDKFLKTNIKDTIDEAYIHLRTTLSNGSQNLGTDASGTVVEWIPEFS